jgi:WD domain, G-beta repeat
MCGSVADGRVLAGTSGNEVLLWNSLIDEPMVLPRHPRMGHGSILGLTFTAEGHAVAIFDNGRIVIYTTKFAFYSLPRPAYWFGMHPLCGLVAVGTGSFAHIWDTQARAVPLVIRMAPRFQGALAFDSTREAICANVNGAFQFWSYTSGVSLGLSIGEDQLYPVASACSPDGQFLAVAFENCVRIWEIDSGELAIEIPVSDQLKFTTIAFHPNGKLITTGSRGLVQLWDPHRWTEVAAYAWRIGWTRAFALSPDGTTAAVGGNLGHVAVWDFE